MIIQHIPIPVYNGKSGNWKQGRQGTPIDTIVIHWIDGSQLACDTTFLNPHTMAAAHFSVEDAAVHQYVDLNDTAFHAGNWNWNLRSIGIEVSASPNRPASDTTYETVARLCSELMQLFPSIVQLKRHNEVSTLSTECCGSVEIGRIEMRIADILVGPAAVTTAFSVPIKEAAHVTASTGLKIRTSPHTPEDNSNWLKLPVHIGGREYLQHVTFSQGQGFWYTATQTGDSVAGNNLWLLLEDGHYVWSGGTDYHPGINQA